MIVKAIILLLLCCVPANAGFFSIRNPYISVATITLFSNSSSISTLGPSANARDYKQNIIPNTNLTQPVDTGLSAVLYDRATSCQLNVTASVPLPALLTTQPKIALVKRGNCSFQDKAYNSQLDGARGVIIYDDIPFEKDTRAGIMDIPPGLITIPVYYVDLDIGQDLLARLQHSEPTMVTADNVSYQSAVRVTLYPSVGGIPSAWEFTLIVVIVLLAVSFLISVGMHWHLWKARRRQRALYENGLMSLDMPADSVVIERNVIDRDALAFFPIRVVGKEGADPICQLALAKEASTSAMSNVGKRPSLESIKSTRSEKALLNAEALAAYKKAKDDGANHLESANGPANHDDMCVICLDPFFFGEQVRQLPCGHQYHRECIDPWLTIKSTLCPLCKHDCSLDIPKHNNEKHSLAVPPPAITAPDPTGSCSLPASGAVLDTNYSKQISPLFFASAVPVDGAGEAGHSCATGGQPQRVNHQLDQASGSAQVDSAVMAHTVEMREQDTLETMQDSAAAESHLHQSLADQVMSA